MQVVYHLGVHCTDEERLVRCLLRNRAALAEAGVSIPNPGRYRKVLRDALVTLRGAAASRETQEVILDAVMDEDQADRIVFSHEFFLGVPQRVIGGGAFYPVTGRHVTGLANLFPDDPCEFHLAICNPAYLVPQLLAKIEGGNYASVIGDADPLSWRWPQVVAQICDAVPDARIVVWCNEDTPLIWAEVLRSLAGRAGLPPLDGEDDFLRGLMTAEGFASFRAFLDANPPADLAARRRATTAFLEKFAMPGAFDSPVSVPGWTEGLVAAMTDAYDRDIEDIAALPGVEVILP